MLKKLAILLTSSLLLAGCGASPEKARYGAEVGYTAIVKFIEIYAVECDAKPKDDGCHAKVDQVAGILEEVHPVVQDARQYTGADVDAALRDLAEANILSAIARLKPIAKEMGYVENN